MEEQSKEFFGTVFVLPESRRFELSTTLRGAHVTLTGTISQHLAEQFAGHPEAGRPIEPGQVSVRPRRVEILTRDIHERNRATRKVHFLMRLVDEDEQGGSKPVPPAG